LFRFLKSLDIMRLAEEYKLITEQLSELYQYKEFVEERIITLEMKLKEVDTLIDFAENLNGTNSESYSCLEQVNNHFEKQMNNEGQKNLFEHIESRHEQEKGKQFTNHYKAPSYEEYFNEKNSFNSNSQNIHDLGNNELNIDELGEKNKKTDRNKSE
jgi:hypothetical protein